MTLSPLVVVVPARNEAERIAACLDSLVAQRGVSLQVLTSDNDSSDATSSIARQFGDRLDLTARTVGPLGPSEHFVSSIRWALATSDARVFALLAGDDTWEEGFASAALRVLAARPDVDVVFPTFVWEGNGHERRLPPPSLGQRRSWIRRARALVLPDARELSNLVYGVYRRDAFARLADAWELGGDAFGADYAAAWAVVGAHRVAACHDAVGRRYVRTGADLLERIGFRRTDAVGPVALVTTYVRLNLAVNRALARALLEVAARPGPVTVQLVRAPQWVWGAVAHLRAAVGRQPL